ncbi:putative ribonuclease H-like domain-containing protein [Tanacetum coccineum]
MAGSEIIIHHTTHPSQTPTQQTPHIVSTIKLPILKKGEYDIWAMKMEHYLAHTDYPIWEVIQRGNGLVSVSTITNGLIKVLPPKTAEETLARERERKARTTLLMVLPEDHLAKFHKMTDAKEMWEAIKSRFEGLHKGYDRFQSLLSQLEIHGAGISIEDANKKFLRSLPSAWSQVSLIMRTRMSGQSQFDDRSGNQDGRRRDTWNTGNKDKEDRKRSETEDISLSDLVGVQTQRNAEKEKEDLKAKVEKWHNSSKNLNILLNSQMSARDKAAAWFGDQLIKDSIYINAARQVITVKPIVNNARPKVGFHKSVSPFRKSFNRTTALRTKFSKRKVNTAEVNAVSVVKGKKETAVKIIHIELYRIKGLLDSDVQAHDGAARASSTNTVNTASTPDRVYDNPKMYFLPCNLNDDEGAVADFTNLETIVNVSPIPTSRIHFIHPSTLILGDPKSAVQTRRKVHKSFGAHAFVYRNKKDERGVVVRNKARLVTQGHRQEEGINYDEVFAPVAKIEAIRIFLAFAFLYGIIVYSDVESDFLYGTIDEGDDELYISDEFYGDSPLSLITSQTEKDGIFISHDKYVAEILKKFDFAGVKTASTPIETQKPLVKDEEASDVDSVLVLETNFNGKARSRQFVASFYYRTEYVVAATAVGKVLWIQNQMFRLWFQFHEHNIYIDNESTICIVKNPLFHSKTKHIAIRHHFIRDAYEKKLIQVLKIHTDDNVARTLTKAIDVISSIS